MANPTQISWKKALGVFEARLADVPLKYGTKLRCWREAVARVHSDLAAKLPDTGLPTLALGKNRRTEGSWPQDPMFSGVEYGWQLVKS
jgi:hypothetical protein